MINPNFVISVISSRKIPGKNQLILDISLSSPIKLSANNLTLILTNDGLVSYTLTTISYVHYQLDILYKATIQNTTMTLTINPGRARLLQEVRNLQSVVGSSFNLVIDTFPPSVYYPETVTNMFDGFSLYLSIISGITLAFSILGFIGMKRAVFYSIELFNLVVIIYCLEGLGLVGKSDWIAYSILGMKNFALIGGFSIGDCNCPSDIKQYTYGYKDQFFQNCGYVLAIDAAIIFLLLLIWIAHKIKNRENDDQHKK